MSEGPWTGGRAGSLKGLRVVDFGQYIAGPACAMLLADQGADVIRVDPPTGPRMASAANAALLRGRRSVRLDLKHAIDRRRALALAASADVLIENFRPGVMDRLGLGAAEMTARAPQLIYVSLPGFGADDPRAAMPAWEGVVMAAGSAYSLEVSSAIIPSGPDAGRPPVFSPLPLASMFGAMEGAVAVVAALIARRRDGTGQAIEVALFDALFETIGLRALAYARNTPKATDFGSGFYHAADGRPFMNISVWFRHLEQIVEEAGLQDWVREGLVDYERLWADPAAAPELRRRLAGVFATRTADEWDAVLRERGCPAAKLRSYEDWLAEPHATASGTMVDVEDPAFGKLRTVGAAARLWSHEDAVAPAPTQDQAAIVAALDALGDAPAPGPATGTGRRKPALDGLRVVDLSRVVAAPTSAKLLGQLGAEVVKIDEEPAKMRVAFPSPAMHETLSRGKQTIALDLKQPEEAAVFRRLLRRADVLVQNFTPKAEARMGLDDAEVRKLAPEVVHVHLSAYGRRGPWRDYKGFAELGNATTGVTERSLDGVFPESGVLPSLDYPRWTFTDYAAGVLGAYAALLGLYERQVTGKGQMVETSLVRATSLLQVLEAGAHEGKAERMPRGVQVRGWGPTQQLYRTADGEVFVGFTEAQRAAVWSAFGAKDQDAFAAALAARSSEQVCKTLQDAGAGGARVQSIGELMAPGGPADQRGLRLDEPSDAFGRVTMPGPVIRFSATPMRPGHLPPAFGSDRQAVLDSLG